MLNNELEQTAKAGQASACLNRVMGVDLDMRVELGRVIMPIRDILGLSCGSVIDLKKAVGEPVDILVNNRLLAKGEVVVVDDALGVRITDIVSQNPYGDDESQA